jgi:putative transposase
MILQDELKAKDIRHQTMKTLQNHLSIEANGYLCQTEMIWDVILKASAEQSSIEAVCADLANVADSNTIRDYLNAALPLEQLRQQESQINAALAESIPRSMVRTELEVAIDFHDEPCYGKQEALRAVTCSGKAKEGTTHFIRTASAYIIWRDVRLTLAVRYVLPEETGLDILKCLLARLKALGFSFKVLYLDKGFACGPVITYLSQQRQSAIIACPIRGKNGGTRALGQGRGSYRTDYTFTDGTQANLAMVATLVPDKTGQRRRKWLAFIVIELDWSPHRIYRRYRRRFGIECSYRLLRCVRARTTSPNPTLRFFFLGIGLILVNTWVFLRWEFARKLAPGPRRVEPQRFRFHRFTRFLIRSIEAIYGVVMAIPTHLNPQFVIY